MVSAFSIPRLSIATFVREELNSKDRLPSPFLPNQGYILHFEANSWRSLTILQLHLTNYFGDFLLRHLEQLEISVVFSKEFSAACGQSFRSDFQLNCCISTNINEVTELAPPQTYEHPLRTLNIQIRALFNKRNHKSSLTAKYVVCEVL